MLIVREKILRVDIILKKVKLCLFLDFKRKIFGLSEKIIGTVFKTAFSVSEENFPEENILLEKFIILFSGLRAKTFRALTETISTGLSNVHANCAGEHFGRIGFFEKKYNFVFFWTLFEKFSDWGKKTFCTVFKTAFSMSEETFPEENILLEKIITLFFGLRPKHFRVLTETISTGLSKVHANCARELFGRCYFDKVKLCFFNFKRKIFGLSKKIIGTFFKTAFSVSEEVFPEENILLEKIITLFFGLRPKHFRVLTETISTGLSNVHANCAGEHFERIGYFEKKYNFVFFWTFFEKFSEWGKKTFCTVFKTAFSISEETFPEENILLEKIIILFFGITPNIFGC